MNSLAKIYCLFLILTLNYKIFSQEVLDKIIAVVDNEIITLSELNFQTTLLAFQRQIPVTPALQKKVLDILIQEKLLIAQAIVDSINVSDDEVNKQLEYQIQYFIRQYGSKEAVEKAYGMSLERIKRELKEEVRKNLLAQKAQEKNFASIEISRREVEEFYEVYKDSVGFLPPKYTLSRILVNPKKSERIKNKYREFAEKILDSLKNGADFEEMAKKYSEDPGTAKEGGNLGWAKKGIFYPEFEAAAFRLNIGEYSGIVETPVGYHIIQLLDKKGESINARHILVRIKVDEETELQAIEFLSDIRDSIIEGANDFEYYAKKYSDDKESAKFGGFIGNLEENQIEEKILENISKLKQGDISYPIRIDLPNGDYAYQIIKIINKLPQRKPTLENDYEEIKNLALIHKKQKAFEKWLTELKSKIYLKINL
jgi:peptidyl-prolyl cis-trans isomerase SurA